MEKSTTTPSPLGLGKKDFLRPEDEHFSARSSSAPEDYSSVPDAMDLIGLDLPQQGSYYNHPHSVSESFSHSQSFFDFHQDPPKPEKNERIVFLEKRNEENPHSSQLNNAFTSPSFIPRPSPRPPTESEGGPLLIPASNPLRLTPIPSVLQIPSSKQPSIPDQFEESPQKYQELQRRQMESACDYFRRLQREHAKKESPSPSELSHNSPQVPDTRKHGCKSPKLSPNASKILSNGVRPIPPTTTPFTENPYPPQSIPSNIDSKGILNSSQFYTQPISEPRTISPGVPPEYSRSSRPNIDLSAIVESTIIDTDQQHVKPNSSEMSIIAPVTKVFTQHWIVIGSDLNVLLLDFDASFTLLIPNVEKGKSFKTNTTSVEVQTRLTSKDQKLTFMKFRFQNPETKIVAPVLDNKALGYKLLKKHSACVFLGRTLDDIKSAPPRQLPPPTVITEPSKLVFNVNNDPALQPSILSTLPEQIIIGHPRVVQQPVLAPKQPEASRLVNLMSEPRNSVCSNILQSSQTLSSPPCLPTAPESIIKSPKEQPSELQNNDSLQNNIYPPEERVYPSNLTSIYPALKENELLKIIQCRYCKKQFSFISEHLIHLKSHTRDVDRVVEMSIQVWVSDRKLKCDKCKKKETYTLQYAKHKDSHEIHGLSCHICQANITAPAEFGPHLERYHPEVIMASKDEEIVSPILQKPTLPFTLAETTIASTSKLEPNMASSPLVREPLYISAGPQSPITQPNCIIPRSPLQQHPSVLSVKSPMSHQSPIISTGLQSPARVQQTPSMDSPCTTSNSIIKTTIQSPIHPAIVVPEISTRDCTTSVSMHQPCSVLPSSVSISKRNNIAIGSPISQPSGPVSPRIPSPLCASENILLQNRMSSQLCPQSKNYLTPLPVTSSICQPKAQNPVMGSRACAQPVMSSTTVCTSLVQDQPVISDVDPTTSTPASDSQHWGAEDTKMIESFFDETESLSKGQETDKVGLSLSSVDSGVSDVNSASPSVPIFDSSVSILSDDNPKKTMRDSLDSKPDEEFINALDMYVHGSQPSVNKVAPSSVMPNPTPSGTDIMSEHNIMNEETMLDDLHSKVMQFDELCNSINVSLEDKVLPEISKKVNEEPSQSTILISSKDVEDESQASITKCDLEKDKDSEKCSLTEAAGIESTNKEDDNLHISDKNIDFKKEMSGGKNSYDCEKVSIIPDSLEEMKNLQSVPLVNKESLDIEKCSSLPKLPYDDDDDGSSLNLKLSEDSEEELNELSAVHKCGGCGDEFVTGNSLNIHKINCCSDNKCSYCNDRFMSYKSLKMHTSMCKKKTETERTQDECEKHLAIQHDAIPISKENDNPLKRKNEKKNVVDEDLEPQRKKNKKNAKDSSSDAKKYGSCIQTEDGGRIKLRLTMTSSKEKGKKGKKTSRKETSLIINEKPKRVKPLKISLSSLNCSLGKNTTFPSSDKPSPTAPLKLKIPLGKIAFPHKDFEGNDNEPRLKVPKLVINKSILCRMEPLQRVFIENPSKNSCKRRVNNFKTQKSGCPSCTVNLERMSAIIVSSDFQKPSNKKGSIIMLNKKDFDHIRTKRPKSSSSSMVVPPLRVKLKNAQPLKKLSVGTGANDDSNQSLKVHSLKNSRDNVLTTAIIPSKVKKEPSASHNTNWAATAVKKSSLKSTEMFVSDIIYEKVLPNSITQFPGGWQLNNERRKCSSVGPSSKRSCSYLGLTSADYKYRKRKRKKKQEPCVMPDKNLSKASQLPSQNEAEKKKVPPLKICTKRISIRSEPEIKSVPPLKLNTNKLVAYKKEVKVPSVRLTNIDVTAHDTKMTSLIITPSLRKCDKGTYSSKSVKDVLVSSTKLSTATKNSRKNLQERATGDHPEALKLDIELNKKEGALSKPFCPTIRRNPSEVSLKKNPNKRTIRASQVVEKKSSTAISTLISLDSKKKRLIDDVDTNEFTVPCSSISNSDKRDKEENSIQFICSILEDILSSACAPSIRKSSRFHQSSQINKRQKLDKKNRDFSHCMKKLDDIGAHRENMSSCREENSRAQLKTKLPLKRLRSAENLLATKRVKERADIAGENKCKIEKKGLSKNVPATNALKSDKTILKKNVTSTDALKSQKTFLKKSVSSTNALKDNKTFLKPVVKLKRLKILDTFFVDISEEDRRIIMSSKKRSTKFFGKIGCVKKKGSASLRRSKKSKTNCKNGILKCRSLPFSKKWRSSDVMVKNASTDDIHDRSLSSTRVIKPTIVSDSLRPNERTRSLPSNILAPISFEKESYRVITYILEKILKNISDHYLSSSIEQNNEVTSVSLTRTEIVPPIIENILGLVFKEEFQNRNMALKNLRDSTTVSDVKNVYLKRKKIMSSVKNSGYKIRLNFNGLMKSKILKPVLSKALDALQKSHTREENTSTCENYPTIFGIFASGMTQSNIIKSKIYPHNINNHRIIFEAAISEGGSGYKFENHESSQINSNLEFYTKSIIEESDDGAAHIFAHDIIKKILDFGVQSHRHHRGSVSLDINQLKWVAEELFESKGWLRTKTLSAIYALIRQKETVRPIMREVLNSIERHFDFFLSLLISNHNISIQKIIEKRNHSNIQDEKSIERYAVESNDLNFSLGTLCFSEKVVCSILNEIFRLEDSGRHHLNSDMLFRFKKCADAPCIDKVFINGMVSKCLVSEGKSLIMTNQIVNCCTSNKAKFDSLPESNISKNLRKRPFAPSSCVSKSKRFKSSILCSKFSINKSQKNMKYSGFDTCANFNLEAKLLKGLSGVLVPTRNVEAGLISEKIVISIIDDILNEVTRIFKSISEVYEENINLFESIKLSLKTYPDISSDEHKTGNTHYNIKTNIEKKISEETALNKLSTKMSIDIAGSIVNELLRIVTHTPERSVSNFKHKRGGEEDGSTDDNFLHKLISSKSSVKDYTSIDIIEPLVGEFVISAFNKIANIPISKNIVEPILGKLINDVTFHDL